MIKRLNRNLLLISIIVLLVGCSKEEIEVKKPTIQVPSTFELFKVETSDVEVYTKNGLVTGDKAKHLGGSKYLFSTIVGNILKVEFREQDTVYVHNEFKPDPSLEEKYFLKYTLEYGKDGLTLWPLKIIPILILDPSTSYGHKLESDYEKLKMLRKLFVVQQNDSTLKLDTYQEVFLRKKWNMWNTDRSLFLTRYTDDDKLLHKQFIDSDTLWIRKQTFYLRKVEE